MVLYKTMNKEKFTIKQHLAKKWAKIVAEEICNTNNGQTLYQAETEEFAEMFKKELLSQMGYGDECEVCGENDTIYKKTGICQNIPL